MTIIRCKECGLRQFASRPTCRRCRGDLGLFIIEIPLRSNPRVTSTGEKLPAIRIGAALRTLRVQQGLSQSSVAVNAQIERSSLSRIELDHASPSFDTTTRLLRVLGVDSLLFRMRESASRRTN